MQIRMSTWLNIADWVLCMARCRSFWKERRGLSSSGRLRVTSPPRTSCCPAGSNNALSDGGQARIWPWKRAVHCCEQVWALLLGKSPSGHVGMAGIPCPAEILHPGDSWGLSLSIFSQHGTEGLILRPQHPQLAEPHLPPSPAPKPCLGAGGRQGPPPHPQGTGTWGEGAGTCPVTHNHVLQRVLGEPAVEKHRDEQIPQRRPEYLQKQELLIEKVMFCIRKSYKQPM